MENNWLKDRKFFCIDKFLSHSVHKIFIFIGAVLLFFTEVVPSFAMMDDDEANIIPQFVRYLHDRNDHWTNVEEEHIFPLPLPFHLYPPRPIPNYSLTTFALSELKYDEVPLNYRNEGERHFYEGEINEENVRIELRFGEERISLRGNTPEAKEINFGPQSFSLNGENAIFEPQPVMKSFVIAPMLHRPNNLRLFLNSICDQWTGCPTLTYEGVLRQNQNLQMTFKGKNQNEEEFHHFSPTRLIYALDMIQHKIGVFVKIKLPHFGFRFQHIAEGDLLPNVRSQLLPREISYDGNHLYQEVREQTTGYINGSADWRNNWGPQQISNSPQPPYGPYLGNFNAQQRLNPEYVPANPLETLFVSPECQRPVQGVKRSIPEGRHNERREPVRKKARTIYNDGQGKFSVVKVIEREWSPVIDPPEQTYLAHTYFDTGILWQHFEQDVRVVPTAGTFADNGNWRPGLYEGRTLQANQIEWKKIDTLPNENVCYQMILGNQGAMGNLLQPEGMGLEDYLKNISYHNGFKYLNLLQDNALTHQFLNETLARMEDLKELRLKFNFDANNSFDNFIGLLGNETIQRNLRIFELRFSNCPSFNDDMSDRLGACLANFRNLQTLNLEFPYIRLYVEDAWYKPTGLIALTCDVAFILAKKSYEKELILARSLAASPSLREIKFYGVEGYDQNNIRAEIQNRNRNIVVRFEMLNK